MAFGRMAKIMMEEDTALNQNKLYYLNLWDSTNGGFRFTQNQPPTLMATSYAVLGLEFVGGLSRLTEEQKTAITNFLMSGIQSDGSFKDPLFRTEDILSKAHDISYFQQETTTFCQQALDALQAHPPLPRDFSTEKWDSPEALVSYFESFPWKNPWLDSNRVMFALSQLCHDADRHQRLELLDIVDAALDWLDDHQSSETGLWEGSHPVSLTNAMAATFHFSFYYIYRHRPVLYIERIIDSCLSLQEPHGLFSGNKVGQTCLDYDALDLLAKASLVTDYRAKEIQAAVTKAYNTILELYNPKDGGFANCKEQYTNPSAGTKAKLLRKMGLATLIPSPHRVPDRGTYSVCWKLLSCKNNQSNAFSTWLRLLALHLATEKQDLNSGKFKSRRLPFLGYHDPVAIQLIYEKKTKNFTTANAK